MIYIRVQTSRMKLKSIINQFSTQAVADETFIAPRPLPREMFKFYIGFGKVFSDSENYKLLSKMKNHSEISKDEYLDTVNEIEFFWKAPKGGA